jgi:choline dehydrogenase
MAGVREIDRLTDAVAISTLRDLGFSEGEITMLARIAFEDPQTVGDPRELSVEDYEGIYRAAFARGG